MELVGEPDFSVATPGALFAMKLRAIEDRRSGGGIEKRAGDELMAAVTAGELQALGGPVVSALRSD